MSLWRLLVITSFDCDLLFESMYIVVSPWLAEWPPLKYVQFCSIQVNFRQIVMSGHCVHAGVLRVHKENSRALTLSSLCCWYIMRVMRVHHFKHPGPQSPMSAW